MVTGGRDGGRGGGGRGAGRPRSRGWVDYEYNYEVAGIDRKGSTNNKNVSRSSKINPDDTRKEK